MADHNRRELSRRGAFAAVAYAFGVTMLSTTLPTPLYPLYRRELGFSELIVTVVFAAYAAGVIIALLVFGNASDAVGRRRVLLPALVVALLSALVELEPPGSRGRGSLVATLVNMGGLGLGPLLAGVIAEYGAIPLRTTYVIDLVLLVPAIGVVLLTPETVTERSRLRRPSLGVPAEVRGVFAQAALAGFAGFVVLGTFTGVSPAALSQVMDVHNLFVIGLVVFAVFAASTAGQLGSSRFRGRIALPLGAAVLCVGALGIAVALWQRSLALLVIGGIVAGFGQGLGFRAGIGAVTAAAPPEQRGAVTSVLFLVLYVGISVPVVGIGLGIRASGVQTAGIGAALAVAALEAIAWLSLVLRPVAEQPR